MNFAETVKELIQDISGRAERPTPALLCRRVGAEIDRYLDRVVYSNDRYMRHPILLWDEWEIMLIAWKSGQVTPIHDHRGVLGGMTVLSGSLAEERFETPRNKPELFDSRTRPEGDLSDIGPTVLHRLAPTSSTAVSLHVYRPPLRTMGIWDSTGMLAIMPSAFDVGEEVLAQASGVPVGQ